MAGAARVSGDVADALSRAAARPINAATGGQGGNVLLIALVIFTGYLFVTRRLQRVLEVIRDPGAGAAPAAGSVASGGTPGIAPADPSGAGLDIRWRTHDGKGRAVDPYRECLEYQTQTRINLGVPPERAAREAREKCKSQLPQGRYV